MNCANDLQKYVLNVWFQVSENVLKGLHLDFVLFVLKVSC